MFKRNEAFTLVELLAVIIILGIILVLAVPRASKMDNYFQNKGKAVMQQERLIIDAAEKYVVFENFTFTGTSTTIKLQVLQEAGYLKSPLINPRTNEELPPALTNITLTKQTSGDITASISLQ